MTHRLPPLGELDAFIAVAEELSFTRAAERLGVAKAATGKAVQRLEASLGAQFLVRSTRSVRLTREGEIYLRAARAAVDGLADARRALLAAQAAPAGRLTVDMPTVLGSAVVMPRLASFCDAHPAVSVALTAGDAVVDPFDTDVDVIVRIGHLADSTVLARKLCDPRQVLVASPGYLERHGVPRGVGALGDHRILLYRGPDGRPRPIVLVQNGEARSLTPPARMTTANGQTLVDATLGGVGLAQVYDRPVADHLASGALVEILPEASLPGPLVHALVPAGHGMPAAVRAFVDFLVTAFSAGAAAGR